MSLHNVTPGAGAPEEFNVIIEIPMNADPIKYEVDHETGALFVDRFMSTAMHYPCNYGYIPNLNLAPCHRAAALLAPVLGHDPQVLPNHCLILSHRKRLNARFRLSFPIESV